MTYPTLLALMVAKIFHKKFLLSVIITFILSIIIVGGK